MASAGEIEAALCCVDCSRVMDSHLVGCRPGECIVVDAFVAGGAKGRSAAMTAMMTAAAGTHEHHDHRVVHAGRSSGS